MLHVQSPLTTPSTTGSQPFANVTPQSSKPLTPIQQQTTSMGAHTVASPPTASETTVKAVDLAVEYLKNQNYELPAIGDSEVLERVNDDIETFMLNAEKKMGKIQLPENRSKAETIIKAAGFLIKQRPSPADLEAVDAYAVAAEVSIAEWNRRLTLLLPPVVKLVYFVDRVEEDHKFFAEHGYTALAEEFAKFIAVKEKHQGSLQTHDFAEDWNALASKFEGQHALLVRLKEAQASFDIAYLQFLGSTPNDGVAEGLDLDLLITNYEALDQTRKMLESQKPDIVNPEDMVHCIDILKQMAAVVKSLP